VEREREREREKERERERENKKMIDPVLVIYSDLDLSILIDLSGSRG
jgi:hypothetical protein